MTGAQTAVAPRKPFRPWFGYLCAMAVASLVYIACTTVYYRLNETTDKTSVFYHSLGDTIAFAFIQWLAGGFLSAMIVLIMPWIIAVKICRRLRVEGLLPYAMIALLLSFPLNLLFSMTPFELIGSSALPSISLALRYQGVSYLIAGLIFGVTYWILSIRTTARP